MYCIVCNKKYVEIKIRKMCKSCYVSVNKRKVKYNISWEEAINMKNGLCPCGNEIYKDKKCKECLENPKEEDNKSRWLDIILKDMFSGKVYHWTSCMEHDDSPTNMNEYLKDRYDDELLAEIQYYEKTGKILDSGNPNYNPKYHQKYYEEKIEEPESEDL